VYGLCSTPPCIAFPSPTHARFASASTPFDVNPFDPECGNVHFPPNGVKDYDYDNTTTQSRYGDCGGEYLVWWYQNMPGHSSGQTFADGRTMQSIWPYLFY
jgi:hypothetical protein